jgi:PAS domain-containing protein
MQSAIIVTDLAGTIRSCNPYAEVFFGRPASELIGHDSAEFAAEPVPDELAREIYEALRAGGKASSPSAGPTVRSSPPTSSIPRCTTMTGGWWAWPRCRST